MQATFGFQSGVQDDILEVPERGVGLFYLNFIDFILFYMPFYFYSASVSHHTILIIIDYLILFPF